MDNRIRHDKKNITSNSHIHRYDKTHIDGNLHGFQRVQYNEPLSKFIVMKNKGGVNQKLHFIEVTYLLWDKNNYQLHP